MMVEHIIRYEDDTTVVRERIVRCRDCKWCMAYSTATYCDFFAHRIPSIESDDLNGFCAWGERKDG